MSAFDKKIADLTAKKDFAGLTAYMRAVNHDRLFIAFLTDYTVEDLEARIANIIIVVDERSARIANINIADDERSAINKAHKILSGETRICSEELVRLFATYYSNEALNEFIDRKQHDYETKALSRAVEGAIDRAIDRDMNFVRTFYDAASKARALLHANESL